MLRLEGIDAFYGDLQALYDVSLEVEQGRVFALVGANAAGKSTTLRVISGLVTPRRGRVVLDGQDLTTVPAHARVDLGVVQVPEGRRLFPFMSVTENLLLGAHTPRARAERDATLKYVYTLFPVLEERRAQLAGSLSGGEQQMCAIGRALMARPRVLLLDEPTEGLAPIYVKLLFDLIVDLRRKGLTILIVEQNVHHVLRTADRAYVIENGRIVMEGQGTALLNDERLKTAYLGL